jgi:hypothetical protein
VDGSSVHLLDKIGEKNTPYVTRRRRKRKRKRRGSRSGNYRRLAILQPPPTRHTALQYGWWVTILNFNKFPMQLQVGIDRFDVSWVDGSLIS